MQKKEKKKEKRLGTLTGELHMARNGAGYLIHPETDAAIWIEAKDLSTALPGDMVTIQLGRDGTDGRIVRIEKRASRAIVGTVTAGAPFARVQPLSPTFRQEFLVPDTRGAAVGDRVVMRLARWENPRLAPEGIVTDVIGPADNPSLDTRAVMEQYELPSAFPKQVRAAAERASMRLDEPGKRLDLRKKFIFTCDPASARDFDDALSLETDKKGNRVLGVHIADVSHFVTPGSPLDKEAYRRSTSVYLVDKVVPMLPEQLSNGVCSLVPDEDRLAFSAFLTFDALGNCIARKFAKSVIRSKARFTYEQVMAVVKGEGGKVKGEWRRVTPQTRKVILALNELAQQLRKRRFAAGALDMEVPEAEIKLDAKGMMTGVAVRPYDESHQLVEECMVAANEAVATELWTRGVKILARLHEPPDPVRLEELRANLAAIGISCGDLSQPRNLARFLEKIKGSPLEGVLSVMVLRSMKRALYSARAIGHFGLAKKFYAHFTSPIRRYPDLVLHRQLASFLAGKGGRLDQGWLDRAAQHTSEREQIADEAERMLVEIKKFRYLEDLLAKKSPATFDAVVGKCASYGLFVDLPDLAIGGMVHVSKLSQTFVRWDSFREVLTDGRQTWQVGTKMKVRVAAVDFAQRKIDFEMVKGEGGRVKGEGGRVKGEWGRVKGEGRKRRKRT